MGDTVAKCNQLHNIVHIIPSHYHPLTPPNQAQGFICFPCLACRMCAYDSGDPYCSVVDHGFAVICYISCYLKFKRMSHVEPKLLLFCLCMLAACKDNDLRAKEEGMSNMTKICGNKASMINYEFPVIVVATNLNWQDCTTWGIAACNKRHQTTSSQHTSM